MRVHLELTVAKRQYRVYALWCVECPECNEDIANGTCRTRQEAIEARDTHEAWHRRDEEGVTARNRELLFKGDGHGDQGST